MSTTIKTAVDFATEIRQELKKRGINSRMVSVKSGYCGYSDYINVTIKTAEVDIREVEKIVKKYQSIDRDERTGDILEGGNTYTRTKYSEDAYNEVIKPLMKHADDLMQEAAFNHVEPITDNISLICEGDKFIARDNRTYNRRNCYSVEEVAKTLYNAIHYDHI